MALLNLLIGPIFFVLEKRLPPPVVTLRQSFSALQLALWDEDAGRRLVSFARAHGLQAPTRSID